MLEALAAGARVPTADGEIQFNPTDGLRNHPVPADAEVKWLSAEQSNSALTVGDAALLKVFRRIIPGHHPEAEMGRHLTEQGFAHAAPLLGEVVRIGADGERYSLAIAQGFVRNQGDAWAWMLDQLSRAMDDASAEHAGADVDGTALADCVAFAEVIGRRLGEMHAVLARPSDDPAFAPTEATEKDIATWLNRATGLLRSAFDLIASHKDWKTPADSQRGAELLARREAVIEKVERLAHEGVGTRMTRVHGDFHLGQVLVASGDAYIIDFEGEPMRPLAERRARTSPLRDVAGLLRSLDYAPATIGRHDEASRAQLSEQRVQRLFQRFREATSSAFLAGYTAAAGPIEGERRTTLLDFFLVEKAAYEVGYEAANRPAWIEVPIIGLANLVDRLLSRRTAKHG
jgi:maltose alpha-D-glucosyltransferase / alpha-amylase